MWNFDNLIYQLESMGVAQVLLPFILVFTLVFAILEKSKILGDDGKSKKYNIVVSLVLGMLFVFPSYTGAYPPGMDPVSILNQSLPTVALIIVAVVMVMILLGLGGTEFKLDGTFFGGTVGLLAVGIVAYIFTNAAGFYDNLQLPQWMYFLNDPQTQSLVTAILIFGLVVYFITAEPKTPEQRGKWKDDFKIIKRKGSSDDD